MMMSAGERAAASSNYRDMPKYSLLFIYRKYATLRLPWIVLPEVAMRLSFSFTRRIIEEAPHSHTQAVHFLSLF